MKRKQVTSSNIDSIGFDEKTETLEVGFKSKDGTIAVYLYADVPIKVFDEFMTAKSHGTYFHTNIKGQYNFVKL